MEVNQLRKLLNKGIMGRINDRLCVKKTRGYTIQNIFVDMEKESQRKIL